MTKQLISIRKICEIYQIPDQFFDELNTFGLLKVYHDSTEPMIAENELPRLEKLMRLYFDLNINMEGIDVILNLLNQMETIQEELFYLKQRLGLYEDI